MRVSELETEIYLETRIILAKKKKKLAPDPRVDAILVFLDKADKLGRLVCTLKIIQQLKLEMKRPLPKQNCKNYKSHPHTH